MPSAVNQLLDIRGLDSAPWWPPAIGWWLVAAAVILGMVLLVQFVGYLRRRPPRWQRDALRHLHGLRRRARKQDPKQTAGELSELLRRIAMARFGRAACAGLAGETWLHWLEARDPTGFRWQDKGQVLLDMPYAPPGLDADPKTLQPLIDAALIWAVASKERKHV